MPRHESRGQSIVLTPIGRVESPLTDPVLDRFVERCGTDAPTA
jgi:hypothetical protein